MDYFYGRGFEDADASAAAAIMSFDVFAKDPKFTNEMRERCKRVLSHPDAPKTARQWGSFAEMLDLAGEPARSRLPNLALVRDRPRKSKT